MGWNEVLRFERNSHTNILNLIELDWWWFIESFVFSQLIIQMIFLFHLIKILNNFLYNFNHHITYSTIIINILFHYQLVCNYFEIKKRSYNRIEIEIDLLIEWDEMKCWDLREILIQIFLIWLNWIDDDWLSLLDSLN